MGFIATGSDKEFKQVPQGNHQARCFGLVDLGTQRTQTPDGERLMHKIFIRWELFGVDDDDKPLATDDGRPLVIGKQYTLSLSKKANLRADLESWRGAAFSDAELRGFDVSKLLGQYCMLTIKHDTKGEKTYANVASVGKWPAFLKNQKPAPVNANEVFDVMNPDMNLMESLPNWLQDKIKASIEFTGETPAEASPSKGHAEQDIPDTDDIPF